MDNLERLRAFCEGLELQEIDELLENYNKDDFRQLGEIMAERIKQLNTQVVGNDILNLINKED